jgi:hypothetical protein
MMREVLLPMLPVDSWNAASEGFQIVIERADSIASRRQPFPG